MIRILGSFFRVSIIGLCLVLLPGLAYGQDRLLLTRGPSTSLPIGTHRPELRSASDGSLVVAVVEPGQKQSIDGQVKHRVYRLDSNLNVIENPFPITRTSEPYGEPTDHRIALVNDEIIVVYQTLNYTEGGRSRQGPSEDSAIDQSLLLARFTLDGEELFRAPIVDRTSDFWVDNFPDHCLLWSQGRLLVSSGSKSWSVHIREVSLNGVVLEDHIFPVGDNGISGTIGNSMHHHQNGVRILSSNSPAGNGALTLTEVFADFTFSRLAEFGGDDGLERHFPTDSVTIGDYTLVTYIGRPVAEGRDMRHNPYHPRLMVFDANYRVVQDIQLADHGFSHVHPTMTILNDQLFVAWSQPSDRSASVPQVQIERFSISRVQSPPPETRMPPVLCGENPWYKRVGGAIPWDLDFRPDEGIRVDGSANPHPGVDSRTGDIWLYTQLQGTTFLSTSQDGLVFSDPQETPGPGVNTNDPRSIQLPDGRWRVYRYDRRRGGFVSSTSIDGVRYQQDAGLRYKLQEIDEGWVGVYTTFANDQNEVLLIYLGAFPGTARLALSTDGGETFSFIRRNLLEDEEYKSCHWIHWDPRALVLSDGRIRLFTMVQGPQPPHPGYRAVGEVFSWTSLDGGHSWNMDPVVSLTPKDFLPFGLYVWSLNDPWVVELPDGRYRMYVAAVLSDDAEGTNQRVGILSATTPS